MNINISNEYLTRDLAEASLLLTKKQKLLRLDRQGKVCWFVFADEEKCKQLSNQFFFGVCLVNAKSYFDAIQTLKNRIFSER